MLKFNLCILFPKKKKKKLLFTFLKNFKLTFYIYILQTNKKIIQKIYKKLHKNINKMRYIPK